MSVSNVSSNGQHPHHRFKGQASEQRSFPECGGDKCTLYRDGSVIDSCSRHFGRLKLSGDAVAREA